MVHFPVRNPHLVPNVGIRMNHVTSETSGYLGIAGEALQGCEAPRFSMVEMAHLYCR